MRFKFISDYCQSDRVCLQIVWSICCANKLKHSKKLACDSGALELAPRISHHIHVGLCEEVCAPRTTTALSTGPKLRHKLDKFHLRKCHSRALAINASPAEERTNSCKIVLNRLVQFIAVTFVQSYEDHQTTL